MRLKTKFQDEDFELGEVVKAKISDLTCYEDDKRFKLTVSAKKGGEHTFFYSSIAEFLEMWEDAPEEPKEYWYLDSVGDIIQDHIDGGWVDKYREQIGNYFESEEEANRAAEKLKALKRLKDKGFRFDGWNWKTQRIDYNLDYTDITEKQIKEAEKDLDLLFIGGEE